MVYDFNITKIVIDFNEEDLFSLNGFDTQKVLDLEELIHLYRTITKTLEKELHKIIKIDNFDINNIDLSTFQENNDNFINQFNKKSKT